MRTLCNVYSAKFAQQQFGISEKTSLVNNENTKIIAVITRFLYIILQIPTNYPLEFELSHFHCPPVRQFRIRWSPISCCRDDTIYDEIFRVFHQFPCKSIQQIYRLDLLNDRGGFNGDVVPRSMLSVNVCFLRCRARKSTI